VPPVTTPASGAAAPQPRQHPQLQPTSANGQPGMDSLPDGLLLQVLMGSVGRWDPSYRGCSRSRCSASLLITAEVVVAAAAAAAAEVAEPWVSPPCTALH